MGAAWIQEPPATCRAHRRLREFADDLCGAGSTIGIAPFLLLRMRCCYPPTEPSQPVPSVAIFGAGGGCQVRERDHEREPD